MNIISGEKWQDICHVGISKKNIQLSKVVMQIVYG